MKQFLCHLRFRGLCILPWLAVLLVVPIAGCGNGVQRYSISGTVTHGGEPVAIGTINFEPLDPPADAASRETFAFARIVEGRYQAEIIGGPHMVVIEDVSEAMDMPFTDVEIEPSPPLFRIPYNERVDFPTEGPVTHDFEIPADHN